MIDITLENFEQDLISASAQRPILLDIWAPWCGPCKALGPVLEKLEVEYAGGFALAKLNADEQPENATQLSEMFGVRSIPFCVLFNGGQPVDGFVGALPEEKIREFLSKHVPESAPVIDEPEDLVADAAEESPAQVLAKLQEALAINPANDEARFEVVKRLLEANRAADARRTYEPLVPKALIDQRMAALGQYLSAVEAATQARSPEQLAEAIAANKRDFDARFELAQRLFAARQFTQAMDELLEILMRDKAWAEDRARKAYVAILELLTTPAPKPSKAPAKSAADPKTTLEVTGKIDTAPRDPVVDQYRRKLSMVLF